MGLNASDWACPSIQKLCWQSRRAFWLKAGWVRGLLSSWACHGLTEDATWILWCLDGQFHREAAKPAHFINKCQISPQVPAQELSRLTTLARNMVCCLQCCDLDNSRGICCRCVSLAPAREFEVNANCVHFWASSGDATKILGCMILVLPIDNGDHVDNGDTRWILSSDWMQHGDRKAGTAHTTCAPAARTHKVGRGIKTGATKP